MREYPTEGRLDVSKRLHEPLADRLGDSEDLGHGLVPRRRSAWAAVGMGLATLAVALLAGALGFGLGEWVFK